MRTMVGTVLSLMLIAGCGQEAPETDGAVITASVKGHTCVGTVDECIAQLERFATPTDGAQAKVAWSEDAEPGQASPKARGELCGGECKVTCRDESECCGPCPACADFCRAVTGAGPKKTKIVKE